MTGLKVKVYLAELKVKTIMKTEISLVKFVCPELSDICLMKKIKSVGYAFKCETKWDQNQNCIDC